MAQTVRKLEPKKTVIGTQSAKNPVTGEATEFKILYGNWAIPEIKGMSMHLPDDRYKVMLEDFLSTAAGEDYIVPTDEEIRSLRVDVELDKKRQERLAKEEKAKRIAEANAPKNVNGASDEDVKRLQASMDALTSQINNIGISVNDIKNEVIDNDLDDEDEDDEEYEDDEGFGTFPKVLLIIAVILCVLNLGLTACNILGIFDKSETVDEVEKTQNTLVIDGQTYTIESTPVELADGETKVSVYAITTTNENGKNVNKVIALGDMDIAEIEKSAKESVATATPEATADSEQNEDNKAEQEQTQDTQQDNNTDNAQ